MPDVNFDYTAVRNRLSTFIRGKAYCYHLMEQGELDSCDESSNQWITFKKVTMNTDCYGSYHAAEEATCIALCLKSKDCYAIAYCDHNDKSKYQKCQPNKNCYFFGNTACVGSKSGWGGNYFKWTLFHSKLMTNNASFPFYHAWLPHGTIPVRDGSKRVENSNDCRQLCKNDTQCSVFNYCPSCDGQDNCNLYSLESMLMIEKPEAIEYVAHSFLEFTKEADKKREILMPSN